MFSKFSRLAAILAATGFNYLYGADVLKSLHVPFDELTKSEPRGKKGSRHSKPSKRRRRTTNWKDYATGNREHARRLRQQRIIELKRQHLSLKGEVPTYVVNPGGMIFSKKTALRYAQHVLASENNSGAHA